MSQQCHNARVIVKKTTRYDDVIHSYPANYMVAEAVSDSVPFETAHDKSIFMILCTQLDHKGKRLARVVLQIEA